MSLGPRTERWIAAAAGCALLAGAAFAVNAARSPHSHAAAVATRQSTPATTVPATVAATEPPTQQVAALLTTHEAYSTPTTSSSPLGRVRASRPYTGERTVLPVIARSVGAAGHGWLHVRLPGRPNGRSGWIAQLGAVVRTTGWHVVVSLSERLVTVYRHGSVVRTVRAVVGAPSTPTPRGEFFVEETIRLAPTDVGAPDALALSARSDVLFHFDGGEGQIGIHGLMNVGGVLGTASSHGCVRLANSMMRWLAARIGPGTPVTVIA